MMSGYAKIPDLFKVLVAAVAAASICILATAPIVSSARGAAGELSAAEAIPERRAFLLKHPSRIPTFGADIAPIIFQHCTPCHRPGEVAPFPLLTYKDVFRRAKLIRLVTEGHYMPPWKPEPGYGEFLDSRRLSTNEIAAIKEWVDRGAPEGNPSDMPALPQFQSGWALGQPDLVVTMPAPYQIPADGPDVYRCFAVPLKLPQDRYFTAFDFHPSNRRIVHHAMIVEALSGAAEHRETVPGAGYPCFGDFGLLPTARVGLWTPGAVPLKEPPGVARVLKKGSDIIVQIHFHPTGKVEREQSSIGFYFSKQPPHKIPVELTLGSIDIDITAGAKAYKVTSSYVVPIDVELLAVIPHAHFLGKEIKASAVLPDGEVKPLLLIKDWDFNWQQWYRYTSPIKLPQGTRVDAQWIYDNSADNARNPAHPPRRVMWGVLSTDEMAEMKLEVVAERQSEAEQLLHGNLEVAR